MYMYVNGEKGGGGGSRTELYTHFEVREEALMLKKVAFTWLATHLPAES